MAVPSQRQQNRRFGLTLVELVVVLVILVALAAIILPQLPNMLGRAHTASSATNISEVNKWVTTYQALYLRFPDQLDSLTDGAAKLTYLPEDGATAYLTLTDLTTLDSAALAQLNAAGVKNVAIMTAAPGASPTYNPYSTTPPSFTPLAGSTKVLTLTPLMVDSALGVTSAVGDKYVVFGLGQASTLIGKGVFEAPVHFEDGDNVSPAKKYQRFGLVFRVNGATLEKAEYVGAVGFHPDGIVGAANELDEYYKLTK